VIEDSKHLHRVALLVSLACVLQVSESMIPHPIPGLRLGLSNMLTLTALVLLGFRYALEITILRVLLSSFVMGTFMSPAFLLSVSGALLSTCAMGFFHRASNLHGHHRFSIIGISIIGALTHNIVQVLVAYALLVRHSGIFALLPWLCIGAVVTGWFTGAAAVAICKKIEEFRNENALTPEKDVGSPPPFQDYMPGESVLHRLSAPVKITLLLVGSLGILLGSSIWLHFSLFSVLLAAIVISGSSPVYFLRKVKRYALVVVAAFLLPVLFNSGSDTLWPSDYVAVTREGLAVGGRFAARILFMLLSGALMARTTSPETLTAGVGKLLIPLRYVGLSDRRLAMILSLSWAAFPFFWQTARDAIRAADLKQAKGLRGLVPLLSNVIAALYLATGPESPYWAASRQNHSGYTEEEPEGTDRNHPKSIKRQ